LCTYGVAGRAIVKACCGDPARLESLQVRFSSPVFPGETVRTEMWPNRGEIAFRARVLERDVVVLNNWLARVAA
jgi:acyl dehydratase